MYPIRVFGIRVPPEGHIEYALYDDTAHAESKEPVTCRRTLSELAALVAHIITEKDPATARLCIHQPDHLRNLFTFRAKPSVREFRNVSNPETLRLAHDEATLFSRMLLHELRLLENAS